MRVKTEDKKFQDAIEKIRSNFEQQFQAATKGLADAIERSNVGKAKIAIVVKVDYGHKAADLEFAIKVEPVDTVYRQKIKLPGEDPDQFKLPGVTPENHGTEPASAPVPAPTAAAEPGAAPQPKKRGRPPGSGKKPPEGPTEPAPATPDPEPGA